MAKLTAKARKALPSSKFAGPNRSYPDQNASHARNALARVANKSPKLKARVDAKVHKDWPGMGKGETMKKKEGKKHDRKAKEEARPLKRSEGKFAGGHNAVSGQTGYSMKANCK